MLHFRLRTLFVVLTLVAVVVLSVREPRIKDRILFSATSQRFMAFWGYQLHVDLDVGFTQGPVGTDFPVFSGYDPNVPMKLGYRRATDSKTSR